MNEPPPGIAPGVAGTLIDERADMRDIIATLIDLARRGILVMEEQGSKNAASLFVSRDWTFSRGASFGSQLAPHEQKLVEALGLHATDSVKLSSMRNKLYNKIGDLNSALVQPAHRRGLLPAPAGPGARASTWALPPSGWS